MPAPTMTIISVRGGRGLCDPAHFVDVAGERLHGFERSAWKHTVTEIEDVSGPPGGAPQDLFGCGKNPLARPEQQRRIHVALDAPVVADDGPRFVDVLAP